MMVIVKLITFGENNFKMRKLARRAFRTDPEKS